MSPRFAEAVIRHFAAGLQSRIETAAVLYFHLSGQHRVYFVKRAIVCLCREAQQRTHPTIAKPKSSACELTSQIPFFRGRRSRGGVIVSSTAKPAASPMQFTDAPIAPMGKMCPERRFE